MNSPRPSEAPSSLTVLITPDADGVRIEVCGEVDLVNHEYLRSRLSSIAVDRGMVIHLDLHQLTFCDSRGCRVLLDFEQRARSAGSDVDVRGASPCVEKVMGLLANLRS